MPNVKINMDTISYRTTMPAPGGGGKTEDETARTPREPTISYTYTKVEGEKDKET